MAVNKEKFSVDEQVEYLIYKGIKFNHINRVKAKELLTYNSYYFKLTSYRKNFKKNIKGKYIGLEFAGLYELSKLDMYFRYIVIQMSLEIEHAVKTTLVRIITEDENEDGYDIVFEYDVFLENKFYSNPINKNKTYRSFYEKIMQRDKARESYQNDLYNKRHAYPSIWVIIELMSYYELINFISFYSSQEKNDYQKLEDVNQLMKYTANLRNVAAHNKPILASITVEGPLKILNRKVYSIATNKVKLSNLEIKRYISNYRLHDFLCLLILHKNFIRSELAREARSKELLEFEIRCKRDAHLFKENDEIENVFNIFCKMLYNYYCK